MATNRKGSVLITGASTGIGRATALYLDRQGYRVFAGVRKQTDAQSLKEEGSDSLTPVTIDVSSRRSINSAKSEVRRVVGRDGLEALFNNAGIGRGGPIEFLDLDDLRQNLEINVVGQVAVTQAFLPLLREAEAAKIVFTSSINGRVAMPFLSPYNASKFGIEALADTLRRELAPWDIKVVVIEPGLIDTPIWAKAGDTASELIASLPPQARKLYGPQLSRVREMLREAADRGIHPDKVARVVERAIRKSNPKTRYLVGTDAKIAARLNAALPDKTFDRIVRMQTKLPKRGSAR